MATEKTMPEEEMALAAMDRIRENMTNVAALNEVVTAITTAEMTAAFDDTYEYNTLRYVQHSVVSELCLALMRVLEGPSRNDNACVSWFFDRLDTSIVSEIVRARRMQHVQDEELERDVADLLCRFAAACKEYERIKGHHTLERVKTFRHTHLAHTPIIRNDRQPLPRYEEITLLSGWVFDLVNDIDTIIAGNSNAYDADRYQHQQMSEGFAKIVVTGATVQREADALLDYLSVFPPN